MSDGLQAYCRECSAEYRRLRQEAKGKRVREKVQVPPGHKRCPQCEEVKPRSAGERNKPSSDGWASYCRERGPERTRVSCVKRKYALTPTELNALAAERQGVCRIASPPRQLMWITATGRVGSVAYSASAAMRHRGSSRTERMPYGVPPHIWKETCGSQHS
ncbi:hypothetical protein TPA0910_39630 [Streptomyces hygroscopicus subsp. sporocinereus]|uniref:Uncharacterized protein n=1 Tax=Streptomyces hygroscopicus TaxID=1912 RepID=A0ABQ3U1Q1_STRHY|nr:hypothetical protein TPA0910_39630 [Streptomyces hygroscopicus]